MPLRTKNIFAKTFHFLKWLFAGLLVLFIALVLFVRSSWGQNIIKNKATVFVSEKIDTKFSVEKLYLSFSGSLIIENLYLEDQQQDTLLYSKELEVSVAILPIFTQNTINVKSVDWTGLVANVYKPEKTNQYNFDYIINAFVDSNLVEEREVQADAEPLEIKVGTINFSNFNLLFNDEVLGVDTHLKLGNLGLKFGNKFDINTFHFPIEKLVLANVDVRYIQNKAFPESEENEVESTSPTLEIDDFRLQNIKVNYQDQVANNLADVSLGSFFIKDALVNLAEQNITVEDISLKNTDAKMVFISKDASVVQDTVKTDFEWPDWKVNVDALTLENNSIALKTGTTITKPNVFNPQDFKINNTQILINNFELEKEKMVVDIKDISFEEKSGFQLKQFTLKGSVDSQKITLSTIAVKTNSSELNVEGEVAYNTINTFINQPENALFNLGINDVVLNVKDAYYFNPTIQQNEYVQKFSKHSVKGNIEAKGSINDINIADLKMKWASKTSLSLSGKIKDVLSENNLFFDLPNIRFKTNRNSLSMIINEKDLGVNIPNSMVLKSSVKGGLSSVKTNTLLTLDKGEILIDGVFKNQKNTVVKSNIKITELDVGKIINNPQIGLLDLETTLYANWKDLSDLNADVTTKFKHLIFDGYDYNALKLNAAIKQGKGVVKTTFKDDNLDFDSETNIKLDSLTSSIQSSLKVNGVNLQALKLTKENLRARLNFILDYKGTTDNFKVKAKTENGLLIYNEESFPIGNFIINTNIAQDTTNVSVASNLLNVKLNANSNPEQISTAFKRYFNTYFSKKHTDTITGNSRLKMELSLSQDPLLDQVFFKGLNEFESITFDVDFNESLKKLNASFNIPYIEYLGSSINNGQFYLNSTAEEFDLDLKIDNVKYSPVDIQNISLQGKIDDGLVLLDFSTSDETEKIININTEIQANDSSVKVHINPNDLVLNRKKWMMPENNALLFGDNLVSEDFTLSRNNQTLSFNAEIKEENNHFQAFDFKNFELLNIVSFLNPEQNIASGILGGNITLTSINSNQNLVSDVKINDLKVLENTLGVLQVNAKTSNRKNYDVNLSLQEQNNIDLLVEGTYNADEVDSPLNLKIDLNKLGLNKLEAFGKEYISNASGYISSNFNMKGTVENPIYNGVLNFNSAKLKVNSFNTSFTFPEESIKVDNSSIMLNKFTILDKEKHSFILDGAIETNDFSNPKFNLTLNTENIQFLNSSEDDNDLYYGKLFVDADVKIGGDVNIPIVTGTIQINKNSDFTYIIPESEIEAVEREGVVVFVNKKVTNDILTTTDNTENNTTGIIKGLDIKTILKVDKSAVLNVIIDKKTGDNLKISGAADLNFGLTPNGRTTLSGKYEVNSGHYEASLYNLVTRKFEIAKGSSILWQGDPLDAKMDIRAIYKVKASASGLMSSVTSGMDAETLNSYRKKIPFWVYLNLNGELLAPEISFDLDIPEGSRGELGREVYTQVEQLNTREEELNKQVFSLLVLNQFFPSSTSDGSNGGSLSIARDNVNKALSNQLNNYSNKLLGKTGVELGFDLESYTDYSDGAEESNTELSISAQKRLFNDRLTVQVGSGFELENTSSEETSIVGNVNIEYALTEDRRFRLKGFRKNEYESIIDGQVIVTGISFLFNREFNKFRELWQKEANKKSTK